MPDRQVNKTFMKGSAKIASVKERNLETRKEKKCRVKAPRNVWTGLKSYERTSRDKSDNRRT